MLTMKITVALLCVAVTGCASFRTTNEKGRPSWHWVISQKDGCTEKIGPSKKGLKYTTCF